jgi:O-antigen ligase
MRGSFAYVSWLMFQDRPFFGFGFGQFPEAKNEYLSDRSSDLPLEQIRGYVHHNTYLSLLTETGLVGLGLFVAMLVGWTRRGWWLWNDPSASEELRSLAPLTLGVLAVYACQLMFHELSYTPIDHSLVFLFAGLTAGLTTRTALERQAVSDSRPLFRAWRRAVSG